ncbi:IS1380 family transposase [Nonomuraea sp. K274]|uniref:IS1380 family transposase n=1 Tax=Nonomuraea cypriaca TaxID=1187855 RepID=A0A931AI66_9ACTN|nr:IS1380 family transposase [Nonomuraea cypriaca]MBF8193121.1 IS1380 family transposase [Nonomuraea cypriaca]
MEKRTSAWALSLEMTGGASGLVGAAGVPLLRLLADRSGLRGRLSKALVKPGFLPGHDRGQVLVDVAVGLALGAVSLTGTMREIEQAGAVLGTTASAVTAWRTLDNLDDAALEKIARARAAHRRLIWQRLAARPQGFPWIEVAGQLWDGWVVVDVDASLVECHSDKEGAAATYKKHLFGLHPLIATIANTGEIPVSYLRKGNAGSNTVADHLKVLTEAVEHIPPRHRKKIIFRVDGAGASKDLLAWIKATAAEHGYDWRYSVGFDVTEPVRIAIAKVPKNAWAAALTPDGELRPGAQVAEITKLLDLADGWPDGMRLLARTEPLHPRHHKQASAIEKQRGQRFQVVAHDLPGHHYPRLDAFTRNHAGVESAIKDAKNLGLRRFPFFKMAANQAWCVAVMLAAELLAWLRLLALDHHATLSKASPATLHDTLLNVPARLARRARKRLIRLPDDHPHATNLILAWTKIRALATQPP